MHARLRRPAVALLTTTLAASVLALAPAAHAVLGTTISGTVSGTQGPLEGIEIELYKSDGDGWSETEDVTFTDAEGHYSIDVSPGEYRVRFDGDYDHAFEFYPDADTVEEAETVAVPFNGNVSAHAVLGAGARINGEVSGPSGAALDDVVVMAYQVVGAGPSADRRYVGFATTEDGAYEIRGLAGGTYAVEFDDVFGADTRTYADEWYDDQPHQYVAETVTVADGGTRSAVDARLELDSVISGRITDADGKPADYAYADALVHVGGEWLRVRSGEADANGYYVIDGLAAGTYRVQLHADVAGQYVTEFWNDQPDVSSAEDVVLGVNDSEADVNAAVGGTRTVANLTAPVISGTPQVGSPLTSTAGTWTPNPSSVEYFWVSGEDVLQSGSNATYVPKAADVGKVISVWVYASAPGYDYGFSHAAASGPVVAAPVPPIVPPVPTVDVPSALAALVATIDVAGKPKVGKTVKLTGLDKLLRSTGVSYRFQWFAGAKKIKKATKSTLKVTKAMKGTKLSVKVTATAASSSRTVKIKVGKVR
jgi:5-hydroxyisourate hydrolase-like protein (transthyretin family)